MSPRNHKEHLFIVTYMHHMQEWVEGQVSPSDESMAALVTPDRDTCASLMAPFRYTVPTPWPFTATVSARPDATTVPALRCHNGWLAWTHGCAKHDEGNIPQRGGNRYVEHQICASRCSRKRLAFGEGQAWSLARPQSHEPYYCQNALITSQRRVKQPLADTHCAAQKWFKLISGP